MKRYVLSLCLLLLGAGVMEARINVFQQWRSGLDTAVAPVDAYAGCGSLNIAEHFADLPVQFTYVPVPKLETGAQWGIRYMDGFTGIRDLDLGAKYQFLEATEQAPGVIGEAAITLPTADSKHNLGTGAVAFMLNWALEKKIREITGYLGLGIQLNSENSDHVRQGNIFFYRAGAGYDYRKDLRLYGELKGYNHGNTSQGGTEVEGSNYQELYLAPGADFTVNVLKTKWDVSGALLIGLTPESQDLAVSFSTGF